MTSWRNSGDFANLCDCENKMLLKLSMTLPKDTTIQTLAINHKHESIRKSGTLENIKNFEEVNTKQIVNAIPF